VTFEEFSYAVVLIAAIVFLLWLWRGEMQGEEYPF